MAGVARLRSYRMLLLRKFFVRVTSVASLGLPGCSPNKVLWKSCESWHFIFLERPVLFGHEQGAEVGLSRTELSPGGSTPDLRHAILSLSYYEDKPKNAQKFNHTLFL